MARRRKSEANKASPKQQSKASAVRKSSRQRAKKQLEEQKVNGDVLAIVNNSEEFKDCVENSHEKVKKTNVVPKMSTKIKNIVHNEKSLLDSAKSRDGESDSQDDLEADLSTIEKLGSLGHKQVNPSDNTFNEPVWSEDVIEETIICEEMEVETEITDGCSITQNENIVLEQVLLVNDSNFGNKNVVEYTVIQNDDGTESMVVTPDNLENVTSIHDSFANTNRYQIIEEDLSVLNMNATEIHCPLKKSKSFVISENDKCIDTSYDFDYSSTDKSGDNDSRSECKSLKNITKNIKSAKIKKMNNALDKNIKKDIDNKKKRTDTNLKNISSTEENKLSLYNKHKLIKTKKPTTASTDMSEENNTLNSAILLQNTVVLNQEDDNSSSMSDKIEPQEISDIYTIDSLKNSKIVNISLNLEQKDITDPADTKIDVSNCLLTKSKNLLLHTEEYFRDSETEGKLDSEDIKVSSSSENSNDTLLSSNSCKILDFNTDNKSSLNQLNEIDKKSNFRSRSGSTDTTGSESGSNSSGVRRSNRIRTIGLMKQRSRGRGLVTKPSVDSVKSLTQERDKLISNTSTIQEKDINQIKDNTDNISETQSDKENTNNKTITSHDVLTPLIAASGTTGYDSDSNKPVKVKSRWRRSSELEMSNSVSWDTSKPNLGLCNATITGPIIGIASNSLIDINSKLTSVPTGLLSNPKSQMIIEDTTAATFQNFSNINIINEIKVGNNSLISASHTFIPKAVGAKISLPMVPVIEDREMEERLSQFEHLKENLYLTERYTSKETKRMVCDCFLTEEEFERGELGCGEDCLNRLLMIECGSRCVVGNRCTNRRFQNCEYAKCEVFRTEKKGFGLRAINDLNAGEFIMEYVGEVIEPKDFRRRAKEYSKDKNRHYYFMALKSDQIIDATMKGNISRFINHSCDPNAETQKWTVNGELRIGFFNTKFVAAGEEITFDYHFQRYGKEAQKCFCEAPNCRGWIGGNPDDNKDKVEYAEGTEDLEDEYEDDLEDKNDNEDKEEKPTKQVRRKREEKKIIDHMEDEDLEEQIDKLCSSGLKNQAHTLTLSRLMVRSREIQHRTRLLKVIQSGEQPCRRLFLDYHGLRLVWSYMMDVAGSTTEEAHSFRLEILKTLTLLPIPNRTMLIDSKVLNIIEKWSKQLYHSANGDSPEDDQSKLKSSNEEVEMETREKCRSENINDVLQIKKEIELDLKSEKTDTEHLLISEIAANLLVDWSNLKEVFRIPKKERIEQMKEHEREADRRYKEDIEKEVRETTSYERHRSDRYTRNELEKRIDRRKGRDSPEFEHSRSKDKRGLEERPNLVPIPRMSKFERRQLFALKVAKEEEERQRRQQEDSWQQHQAQCIALGLDPYTTAAFDPQSGYPLFFNPQLGQWQPYPMQAENSELGQQCTPVYIGSSSQSTPIVAPPLYSLSQQQTYGPFPVSSNNIVQVHNGTSSIYAEKRPEAIAISQAELETDAPPPLDLPPKWKWARDKRGRIYYYHTKERVSQWLPPPPDHIAVQPDSSTTSESSDESSSSNDEEDEDLDEQFENQSREGMELDVSHVAPISTIPETKKRREGLVQERIISPRREEDRVDHKKYKEIKEKLRRQKEKAKLKEHFEKMRKHRRSKSKVHIKHTTSKFQPITSDMSPTMERKIKDTFRINMANVMVHFLNPYRKNDCKQGRITNTEDFKHLARKLTHFVLAKELKHCKSVDELECNDNVKHKAKDFVRKYMSKFGAVYQKGTDED